MPGQATLKVYRDDQRDIRFREAVVLLDDKPVANLAFGKSVILKLEAGTHVLQATNRMFKTKAVSFTVKEDDTQEYVVANIANGCFGVLMLIQMAPPTIILEPRKQATERQSQ